MAVATTGSFRQAADHMGMSQPALSQNIAALEARIGTLLFARSKRMVRLTVEGAELHRRLERLIPALYEAMDHARDANRQPFVKVRLGFLASAAVWFLPQVIFRFKAEFPDVDLHVRDGSADDLFDMVHDGEINLGVSSFLPHQGRDVLFERIYSDPFRAVLRRDHPLAGKTSITWAELLRYDFIGANSGTGTRYALDVGLRGRSLRNDTILDFAHLSAVVAMVEAQMGISALPTMNCPPADHPVLCTVNLVEPVITRDLGILTNLREGQISKHVTYFRDKIIAAVKDA